MISDKLIKKIESVVGHGNLLRDEPMKDHTWMKVGGPAKLFVTPRSEEEFISAYRACLEAAADTFILGNGSNLIIRDEGLPAVVLNTSSHLNTCRVDGELLTSESGLPLKDFSQFAQQNALTGLEFACGIPGTVGGAVFMNAGAYDGEMKMVVTETEYLDHNGEIKTIWGDDHDFGYRHSRIMDKGGMVLRTTVRLKRGDGKAIQTVMDDFNRRRAEKQPLEWPSCGSVFKRPPGYFAGKLITDSGLKGHRIGGAEVSTKHAGFIVNVDNASADDVLKLIAHVQKTVKEKFGVDLEREVRVVPSVD